MSNAEDKGSVIDLASRQRAKLETELARVRASNEALIELAKANLAAQAMTHSAVLAVVEADSLIALDRKLAGRVAGVLGVEAVRIFIEGWAPVSAGQAIHGCAPNLVETLLGTKAERLGPVDERYSDALYGPLGPGLRSEAIVRLDLAGLTGLLCLAARDSEAFQPQQAADLLHFLARVLERRIVPWLNA